MSKVKETQLALPVETQRESASVEGLIAQAIQNNLPVEQMERLLAMREKMLAERARAAYVQAVAQFQSDLPVIKKTKKVLNKDGRTVRYQFAPLDSIVEQIKRPLANLGLSYRWETRTEEGGIVAVCTITHVLGHAESSEFKVPVDSEGYMTAPQKVASALTFAKRYSLTNALGISTGDEDTDATDVKKEAGPKSDKAKIVFLLRTLGSKTDTKTNIEKAVKVATDYDLTPENYGVIVERLEILVKEAQDDNSNVRD